MYASLNLCMINQIVKVNQKKNTIPFYSASLKTFSIFEIAIFDGIYITNKRITTQFCL